VQVSINSNGGPAIGICGSYGGLNVGDEAILTVMLEQLRGALPAVKLTVFTRDVGHTQAHHQVDRVIGAREALRHELVSEVEQLDLLLLGGGGILYDREAESYLHLPRIAQSLGVPTSTYAIGAGPLERPDDRRAVAEVLNAMAGITVRDVGARRLLEEIGVERQITVTADPALLLQPQVPPPGVLERAGSRADHHLVGISVREPGGGGGLEDGVYHRVLADAADFVADRYDAELVFVPMERQDVRHAHRVIAEMGLPERATVLKDSYGPREVLGIMGQLDMAIGMRLHFAVFAALAGVPVLALPYAAKVTSFLERIGLPAPELAHRQHAGTLLAAIDRLWDCRRHEAELVQARLPGLRDEARRTTSFAAELLLTEVGHAPARAP
jgi:polysaccharide pyruvyl transferase CsaB